MPATFGYAKQKTFLPSKPTSKNAPVSKVEHLARGQCFMAPGGNEYDRKGHGWYGKKQMPEDTPTDRSMGGYNDSNGYGMGKGSRIQIGRMFMPGEGNMGVAGAK